VVIYPAQAVDQDLYKLSVQLFRQDRDRRPSAVTSPRAALSTAASAAAVPIATVPIAIVRPQPTATVY